MDKIYSRRKIRLPEIKTLKGDKNKLGKIYFVILIFTISIFTGYKALKAVDPIFEGLCNDKAQSIATEITNIKSSEVLARYNYQDTVKIIESDDGRKSLLKTDIVLLNQIISDITIEIQNELNKLANEYVEIPLGALTGNKYLVATGPKVIIKIISTGDIITDIKTEFKGAGINQTIYRIYLSLECSVSVLTSYKTIDQKITNQVLLVETVVVGDVPETFLELDNT